MRMTKSINRKFADDPDPYNTGSVDPRLTHQTVAQEAATPTRAVSAVPSSHGRELSASVLCASSLLQIINASWLRASLEKNIGERSIRYMPTGARRNGKSTDICVGGWSLFSTWGRVLAVMLARLRSTAASSITLMLRTLLQVLPRLNILARGQRRPARTSYFCRDRSKDNRHEHVFQSNGPHGSVKL